MSTILQHVLGPEHPETSRAKCDPAGVLYHQGSAADAESEYRAILSIIEAALGPKHRDALAIRCNLAMALQARGKFSAAETELQTIVRVCPPVLRPKHHVEPGNLAAILSWQGKLRAAEAEQRVVLIACQGKAGEDAAETLRVGNNLAESLLAQGKDTEAEAEH